MEKASIARALKYLMDRDKVTVTDIVEETGLNQGTVSKLKVKETNQADLEILEKLADFFGEDISIFCGVEKYKRPVKLTDDEKSLLEAMHSVNDEGRAQILNFAGIIKRSPEFAGKSRR